MTNPLVSIIIPTFNRVSLIGETLDSIRFQNYENWECLVVDDGSMDYTEELLGFYMKIDSRIRFYKRPESRRKGASTCRNIGLENSNGKYIQFLDSDDIISKEKIESQVKEMEEDCTISLTTCKWGRFKEIAGDKEVYEDLTSYSDFNEALDFLNSLSRSLGFFPLHAYLIKRDLVLKSGYWNEYLSINDDAEFMMRIILNSDKIAFSKKGYSLYRWPLEGNLSSYKNFKTVIDSVYSWQLIEAYLKIRFKTTEIDFLDTAKRNLFDHIQDYPEIIQTHKAFFEKQLQLKEVSFKKKILLKIRNFR